MTVFGESLHLLREAYGGFSGFGGCQGKAPSVCFVKCMAVLADVSVCNLHMLRPTSETQNCEKNKCGAQNGGFDAFEGTQCLTFLQSLMLRDAFGGVGCSIWRFWRFQFNVAFGGFGGFNLGPTLGTTDQTHTTATRPQDHKWKPE